MRFFLSLISALQLLRYANEGFLTGPPQIVQLTGKGIERQLARNNNVSIGIIGAGFAGLSAYQRLVWHGFSNVHLLEASSRIGGRVFPLEFEGSFLHQGAEFINGEGNPIFEIAERLGLIEGQVDDAAMISSNAVFASTPGCQVPPDRLLDKFANFTAELELHYAELAAAVPQLWNVTIAELFDQDFAQFLERENSTSQLVRAQYESLARMYRSYYEGEWSAPIEKLALRNYAQWKDGTQSSPFSSYTLDARGYAPILEELGRGIPEEKLHLNSRVVNIDYRGPHIQLRLQRRKGEEVGKHGQRMWTDLPDHFDFVIVTVPIGHLKRFAPALFTPPLPALKRKAIDAIGFGAMQKVFLIYDRPFWPANMSSLVTLSCPAGRKGNGGHELIRQSLHTLQPRPWASTRVLVAWLSGDGPALINGLGDHELGTIVTGFLRDLFPQNKAIDEPDKIIRTKWLQDELFLGSYTYLTPEASHSPFWPDPFPVLAAPISGPEGQPRLLFAGEGTHSQMYQTTVGAFLSGQREADRVADHFALQAQQHNKCWAEN